MPGRCNVQVTKPSGFNGPPSCAMKSFQTLGPCRLSSQHRSDVCRPTRNQCAAHALCLSLPACASMPHLNAPSSKKPSLTTPEGLHPASHVPLNPGCLPDCQFQAIVGCGYLCIHCIFLWFISANPGPSQDLGPTPDG